ncbi:MAG TPA: histidine kinase [Vicinamibacterales bacterium]|nr:histidine kinase [Vicinamibacterales bacterium]
MEPRFLTANQFLLTTLVFKLAVMALLATMLVRYRRFRHILIFERRGVSDRLTLALGMAVPLAAGVASRILLRYDAADLTLEGAFVVGLVGGPYAGALVGAAAAAPALIAGEFIALPFAVGCGFAGGGLRELCPKESIWHFSPFVFSSLHRRVWRLFRRLEVDWQVILLVAPLALEMLRQALGRRFGMHRLFYLETGEPGMLLMVLLATILCVATPIKIWNNARIEHRLQEQEKLLMAARVSSLASQINPHFLFNTLASIQSLIRSQPETARMVISRLSTLLRRLLRSQDHFVPLREELASIDEYLDIEVIRFGPQLRVEKDIDPEALDVLVPSMILQPIVENSIKHGLSRKVGGGRVLIRAKRAATSATIEVIDDGVGMDEQRLRVALDAGIGLSNVNERLRVIYGEQCRLRLRSEPNAGTSVSMDIPHLAPSEERALA